MKHPRIFENVNRHIVMILKKMLNMVQGLLHEVFTIHVDANKITLKELKMIGLNFIHHSKA